MLCAVYKTRKKQGMYLYIVKKGNFDDVPAPLLERFGHPELVTILSLDKRDKVAGIDKKKLEEELSSNGFYLQMPPKEDDLLSSHREALGLSSTPDVKF